nr:MAG TPA: hypothetical protein [Caudoviricetes sp.]
MLTSQLVNREKSSFFMQTRSVWLSCRIIIRYVNYRVSASWRDRYSFFI